MLSKALGSRNALNVVLATMDALSKLREPADIAEMRGKPAAEMRPFWERGKDEQQ
jgi:small subunit ribosomal protein S5